MNFSLFYPDPAKKDCVTLSEECINDLSLGFIAEALTEVPYERELLRGMMTRFTADEDVIRYRCDIFDDFLRLPELRKCLKELLLELKNLMDLERFREDAEAPALWSLVNRLREIDSYVKCITSIKTTLEGLDIRSGGMKELLRIVTDISRDSGFDELKADIDETLAKAQRLKSITIGVNLDELLRPKNAAIVSLNDTEYTNSGLMRRFMGFSKNKSELNSDLSVGPTRFHPLSGVSSGMKLGAVQQSATHDVHIQTSDVTGADPLSNAIKKPVTDIMRRTVNEIKSTLKRYVNISGYSLTTLTPEITFYIRWAELVEKIIATGMPMCKARILPADSRELHMSDLYNLKLAINKVRGEDIDIITNDIDFDDRYRIFILTGPNRGGKTVFTQAVGLAVLLAQWGVYVPASAAGISPCDNIYTHFPADENDTVDLGRLGEESRRLSAIFGTATGRSLLLLNESLATTSIEEGLFIARDVVRAMRYLGCLAVFNTHMHDLARGLDEMNTYEGDSRVESLVTGVHDGRRSFKVAITPPQGTSYAKDIALRYGVTFDTIKQSIDKREHTQ